MSSLLSLSGCTFAIRGPGPDCEFIWSAGTYYAAIMGNFIDFQDKVVMDVGAGSGILSLFAAQVR